MIKDIIDSVSLLINKAAFRDPTYRQKVSENSKLTIIFTASFVQEHIGSDNSCIYNYLKGDESDNSQSNGYNV